MQAQALRQQTAISSQQSLAVIKTLLSASFGCIAYLRNLLPDENFGEGRLTSGDRGSMSYGGSSQESSLGKNQRQISGVTIKTVTRGFSTEADKLLNYLEHGIFDAIERQYLKSFIFAIYLDHDDPNNIVEAYTYTLTYFTVPGTTTTVPIMSLDDQLSSLSLNGGLKGTDPVALSTLKGKAPTLGDVKQSVKALIKNLIIATQSLEPLPKRRFASFKLFYRNNTPPEYEPPYFRPGDPEKDKFVFTTHNKSEVPEKFSVGAVATPHHGIDLQVQSVAKYIPNGENNDSEFYCMEHVSKGGTGGLSGTIDSGTRSRQVEAQRKDAEERIVAWNAEDLRWTDADADGEEDPDFVNDSGISLKGPLGMRKTDGSIVPIENQEEDTMETDAIDVQFFGKPEIAPSHVGQLRAITPRNDSDLLEATQQLEATQILSSADGYVAEYSAHEDPIDGSIVSRGIDTQMLRSMLNQSSAMEWTADNEMLDMETQPAIAPVHDSIESYSQDKVDDRPSKAPLSLASNTRSYADDIDEAVCACQLSDGGDLVFCDGCQKWLHLWYHSPEDSRLPSKYVCIPCRLQGDVNFHLIKDAYSDIFTAFMDLALFRRAIKVAEEHNPGSLKEFRSVAKCGASLAEQLWKRLEREVHTDIMSRTGFITLEVTETDKLGLIETRSRTTRSAAKKKVKSSKQVHKYIFDKATVNTAAYKDYFNPDSEAEKTMLGLKNMGRRGKSRKGTIDKNIEHTEDAEDIELNMESQTQDETQFVDGPVRNGIDHKRRTGSSQEIARASKKVKVSVVEGVDIEE
ncbi:DNA-binding protein [Phellopilus nigrolimitatus]|nr:DNA-binding protein [Phellopilus nigrolimitatus]